MIEINFLDPIFNWEALAAIGTVLSAFVALIIATFSFHQNKRQGQQLRTKEAIETLMVPIMKELSGLFVYKWDAWTVNNRWHFLREKKDEFPLQYYSLKNANKKLVEQIEVFDRYFYKFNSLNNNHDVKGLLQKIIADSFRDFVKVKVINITGNAGKVPNADDQIINSHWRGYASDGIHNAVVTTLYSLVLWRASLSNFIEDRKVEVDTINFSLGDLVFNPEFDVQTSNELLTFIESKISEHPQNDIIKEYREKWGGLYKMIENLVEEVEQWYESM